MASKGRLFVRWMSSMRPPTTGPAELLLEEIVGNYKGVIAAGQPGSEDILIAALNRFPDYGMALDFLNSGNSKLEDAVRSWASAYGYRIIEGGGGQYVGWVARGKPCCTAQ